MNKKEFKAFEVIFHHGCLPFTSFNVALKKSNLYPLCSDVNLTVTDKHGLYVEILHI